MDTETKVLHIRRATVTDAVNIFKLIVDEEKRAQAEAAALDDGTRVVDIIGAIQTGYVSVAVTSGRIVGVIGGLVSDLSGAAVFAGTMFALSPSFHDTAVGSALVSGLVRWLDQNNLSGKFTLSTKPVPALADALAGRGFTPKMVVMGYTPGEEEDVRSPEPDERSEPAAQLEPAAEDGGPELSGSADAGDPGFDPGAGAGDPDVEPPADAVPDFAAARPVARRARKRKRAA